MEEIRPEFHLNKNYVIAEASLLLPWKDLVKIMERNGLEDVAFDGVIVVGRLVSPEGLRGPSVTKWRRGVVVKMSDEAVRIRSKSIRSVNARRRARVGSWR